MNRRQVYALVDPRDGTVRYIGVSKDAHVRLAQHMREVQNAKRLWLSELKELGLSPEVEVLEIVEAEGDVDSSSLEREQYWINMLLQSGAPLTNVSGIPHSETEPPSKPEPKPRLKIPTDTEGLTPLQKARFEAGLPIKQLADEARVSDSTIHKMERGESVKIELAVRVCRVLSHHLGHKVTYQSLDVKTIKL